MEDDYDLARLIQVSLRPCPATVFIAHDGFRGLTLIHKHLPDLILLDLNLPGMNGWEILSSVHADPILNHIPIIILTAIPRDDHYDHPAAEQIAGYIVKPFTPRELRASLEPILAKPQAGD
jgi:two-component system OmpR family response regulator